MVLVVPLYSKAKEAVDVVEVFVVVLGKIWRDFFTRGGSTALLFMQFFKGGQLELSAELTPVGRPDCLDRCPTLLFKAPLLERLLRLFF